MHSASYGFLRESGPPNIMEKRKAMILYPAFLFYIVIAWLVVNDAPAP